MHKHIIQGKVFLVHKMYTTLPMGPRALCKHPVLKQKTTYVQARSIHVCYPRGGCNELRSMYRIFPT
jgi:hypothetical protein